MSVNQDLTTFDPQTGALVRLFNPRIQVWDDQFGLNGPLIVDIQAGLVWGTDLIEYLVARRTRETEIQPHLTDNSKDTDDQDNCS